MQLEVVSISAEGRALAGLWYRPDSAPRPIALLFAHGFTSGKFSMDPLASYLAGKGYEGLTFDFVGHKLGGSGGEMQRTEQAAENLRDALTFLRQQTEAEKIVLVGHSMGGGAALQVAAWEQKKQDRKDGLELAGMVCMCMGPEPARGFDSTIGQAMLAQRSNYVAGAPALELLTGLQRLVTAAQELGELPALFIAARQDVLVPVAKVETLAAMVGPHAQVTVIESSHLEAPDRARGAIAQWLETLT